jgi:hypothetical protein
VSGDTFSSYFCLSGGRGVSFQITVMKVLAGHPEGRASIADLKQYVAVLTCSGPDWSQRMKRLAGRAPNLDIFSSRYVVRDARGWQITDAGRAFLTAIEAHASEPALVEPEVLRPVVAVAPNPSRNVIQIADYAAGRRGRTAA